jgi:hypothetical protein
LTNMCVYLFLDRKSYLCGLIRDCAFIDFGLEIFGIRDSLTSLFWFSANILKTMQFPWIPKSVYSGGLYFILIQTMCLFSLGHFCKPVCLFESVLLLILTGFSYLCAYLGLCVNKELHSTHAVQIFYLKLKNLPYTANSY